MDLPPLNALRTFDAVARHLSMTNAAKELRVTQTAVSHQIRLLEEYLATRLLVREPGRLGLTAQGRAWATALGDVFARLHAANRRLRLESTRATVSITAIPSFAAGWLVPRLGAFLARYKDVDVRISATEKIVDLAAEGIDVGIRYGTGRYAGMVVDKLLDDTWVVVCAPELASRIKTIADLHRIQLLRDDEPDGWESWLAARGIRDLDVRRGPELTDSAMVVAAAIRGQGVALARWSLAADALAQRRLVRPFPRVRPVPTGRAYYFVAHAETLLRPEVAAFRKWLAGEITTSLRPTRRRRSSS